MSHPMNASAASSNHAKQLHTVLTNCADRLSHLTADEWASPSLCVGWSIRDVAGHMVWRIGSSTLDMLWSGAEAVLGRHSNPLHIIDEFSRATAEAAPEDLVEDLREIADEKARGLGRTGLPELSEAVVHSFDMMQPLHLDLGVDAEVTHQVALGRLPLLSFTARRVLTERTLVAADAGWSVGSGTAIRGTAQAIVLYLFGRSALAPRTDAS